MIRDLLQPAFIESQREFLASHLADEANALDVGATPQTASERYQVTPADLRAAADSLAAVQTNPADPNLVYIPCNRHLSLLQIALETAYLATREVHSQSALGLTSDDEFIAISDLELPAHLKQPPEALGLTPFQEGDPRYAAGYLYARLVAAASHSPVFPDEPARATIAPKSRVVLFGDWGSGVPRAQTLANSIKALLAAAPDREGHAVHLGDVYFAGFADEYRDRVLPYWPGAPGRSWNIAGNHDVYSGGADYLSSMIGAPIMSAQQGAAWFVLENENWQILGLDSAFDPPDLQGSRGRLAGNQAAIATQIRRENSQKGGILLTHHQPFNTPGGDFDIHSHEMIHQLRPMIYSGLVKAWFWGHEHDCVVYKPWTNVEYCCLTGHAGVPAKFKQQSLDSVTRFRWQDSIRKWHGHYATMGFTVLDFDGPTLEVSFYNESGIPQLPTDGRHILRAPQ